MISASKVQILFIIENVIARRRLSFDEKEKNVSFLLKPGFSPRYLSEKQNVICYEAYDIFGGENPFFLLPVE